MGKLEAALTWASRGFRVFPLIPNGKTPAFQGSWYDLATTDEQTIRSMWTDPQGYVHDFNIGVDCSEIIVADIDEKFYTDRKTGQTLKKQGMAEYSTMGGNYDTLVVRTPSGGYHCYFEGSPCSNASLSDAVDVRSHHGYVVAPGSTINGVAYEVINDREMAWLPLAVEQRVKPLDYRRSANEVAAIDSPASIAAGQNFLLSAPVAFEGSRGDETTFKTAARLVREFALSVDTAFALLRDNWNARCIPPWDLQELYTKVVNAAQYGNAEMGRLDPSVAFASVQVVPPPTLKDRLSALWGNAVEPTQLPPRPWMMDKVLMLHEVTALLAPGAVGKSSFALALAAHLALGRDFGPYKTHVKCRSIIYNGEDDRVEMSRRLLAVCQSYNLSYKEVSQSILLISAEDIDLRLVSAPGRQAVVNEEMVTQLIELASDNDIGLLVLDPLVDIHEADETDNSHMNTLMKTIKRVAKSANVAVLVPHHTSKGGGRQEDRVGNMDIGRGASGIIYKTRISFTLLNASQQDATEYDMQDHERDMWVRLDDAKMNLALSRKEAVWFMKEGIRLPNGDTVGVLKHSVRVKGEGNLRVRIASIIIEAMVSSGAGSLTLTQAVKLVKDNEPLMSNKTDVALRGKLEAMLTTAVDVKGQVVQIVRDVDNPRAGASIILT